jgi:hypothetical protein
VTAKETRPRAAVEISDSTASPPRPATAGPKPGAAEATEALQNPELATEADLEKYLLEVLSDVPPPPEPKMESKGATAEKAGGRPPCGSGKSGDCAAAASAGPEPSFRLEGISFSGGRRFAIINGTRLFEGESISGAKVSSIADSEVRLELNGRTITLRF